MLYRRELRSIHRPRLVCEALESRCLLAVSALNDQFQWIEDGGASVLDVLLNDSTDSGNPLSVVGIGQPSRGGSLLIEDGSRLVYSPAKDFFGQEIFRYEVSDGIDPPATATVTVSVAAVNDSPTLATAPSGLVRGAEISFTQVESSDQVIGRIGDTNGDGSDDMVIGMRCDEGEPCWASRGSVRVVSGTDGTELLSRMGAESQQQLGFAVDGAGDANGDGTPDFIVGGPGNGHTRPGIAMVYSGTDGLELYELQGEILGDDHGKSIAGLGDVNGDGFSDVIVGAPRASANGFTGTARVYSGRDGSILYEFVGQSVTHPTGRSVRRAGDVNADGLADFIVDSHVYSGTDGSLLHQFNVDTQFGPQPARVVESGGDVNGDGYGDLIVGGPSPVIPGLGNAWVHSGRDGSLLHTFAGNELYDQFGRPVASAGDVNGDGLADILVSAVGDDSGGRVRLYSGDDGRLLSVFVGEFQFQGLGFNVTGLGDVNADGLGDIAIGRLKTSQHDQGRSGVTIFQSVRAPVSYRLPVSIRNAGALGATVSSLFPELLIDPDQGARQGIAIRGVTGSGTWQFSLDGGQSFADVGAVTPESSLLLREQDRIRFVTGNDDANTASLEIIGWDETAGSAADRVDTRIAGGDSPFSVDSTFAFLDENRAARLLATNLVQRHAFQEGAELVPLDDMTIWSENTFARFRATLGLEDNAAGALASTTAGSPGRFDAGTGTWEVVGSVQEINQALSNLQFRPPSDHEGDVTIQVSIVDLGDSQSRVSGSIDLEIGTANDAPTIRPEFTAAPRFRLEGPSAGSAYGFDVSRVGDVDLDGVEDFIVGAPLADATGEDSGAAYIISGALGTMLRELEGDGRFDQFGSSVSGAGDVDSDGVPDVIVGAHRDDGHGHDSGGFYVYSGASGQLLYNDYGDAYTRLGSSVGAAGDVNADGFDDFIVRAPDQHDDRDNDPALVRVYSGRDGSVLHRFIGQLTFGKLEPRTVDGMGDVDGDGHDDVLLVGHASRFGVPKGAVVHSGADGAVLYVIEQTEESFGRSLATTDDLNDDGIRDIVVGSSETVYVYSGQQGNQLHVIRGPAGSEFGTSVASLGDVDGDGRGDFAVGAPLDENVGRVRVYSGWDATLLLTLSGNRQGGRFGETVAGIGDVTSDGRPDLLIGIPSQDHSALDAGGVILFETSVAQPAVQLPPIALDDPPPSYPVQETVGDVLEDLDDNDAVGIGVISALGRGAWEYSIDDGQSFAPIGNVGVQRSLLLGPTDHIRYLPLDNQPEDASLVFVAWDQTTGRAGERTDSSESADNSFSADTATVSIDVNQAENQLSAANVDQWHVFMEDSLRVELDDIVVDQVKNDPLRVSLQLDDPKAGQLTADTGNGEVFDHETGQWLLLGTTAEVNAALSHVAFLPSADYDRAAAIKVAISGPLNRQPVTGIIAMQPIPENDAPTLDRSVRKTKQLLQDDQPFHYFGNSVDAGKDVNGDGFPDILATAPYAWGQSRGAVIVLSGLDHSLIHTLQGPESFGTSAILLEDVNGDSLADIAVGAPKNDENGNDAGLLRVISGRNGETIYEVAGDTPDSNLGRSLGRLEDVNGDGLNDLIVGNVRQRRGSALILSGATGQVLHAIQGDSTDFGLVVTDAGDINSDGSPDMAITNPSSGSVHFYSGTDFSDIRTLQHQAVDEGFGSAVSSLGDVNGDGYADVIVGAPRGQNPVGVPSGYVRVYSGQDGSIIYSVFGESGFDGFGGAVSSAGDYDHDGTVDFLVGEPGADNGGENSGSVYVFSGVDASLLFLAHGDTHNQLLGSPGDAVGNSVAAADLNGDGQIDIIAGAPQEDWEQGSLRVFTSAGAITLAENAVRAADGAVVGRLFFGRFHDPDTDAQLGVATHRATGEGTWEFSIDDGVTFKSLEAAGTDSTLLLRATDRLRYVPGIMPHSFAAIELFSWDQSSGLPGQYVEATGRGGTTSLSIDSVTALVPLSIGQPVLAATNLDQTHVYLEDTSVTLDDIRVDVTSGEGRVTATLILTSAETGRLTADTGNGETYDEHSGVWTVTGSQGQVNAALAGIEFFPTQENSENSVVSVSIVDPVARPETRLHGTISLHVTPTNDAPVLREFGKQILKGDRRNFRMGDVVRHVGDTNADGFDDLAVSFRHEIASQPVPNEVHIYSTSDGKKSLIIRGEAHDSFGSSLDGVGDVNDDGHDDLVITSNAGFQVFSGADGTELYRRRVFGWGTHTVRRVGDVDADAYDDFAIIDSGAAKVTIHSGRDGNLLQELPQDIQNFTWIRVEPVGDINLDGRADFAIGTPCTGDPWDCTGSVVVHSGADFSAIHQFSGERDRDYFGQALAALGDTNGDGYPDLAVAAPQSTNSVIRGSIRVISGRDGARLYDILGTDEVLGNDERTRIGNSIGSGGDVNGDGVFDLVATAGGVVLVFSGADGSPLASINSDSRTGRFSGEAVIAGDLNHDGRSDIVAADPESNSVTIFLPIAFWPLELDQIDERTRGKPLGQLLPEVATDADGNPTGGIAIHAVTGNGSWQYSLDDGGTFVDFGEIESRQSLLLRTTDRVRYLPDRAKDIGSDLSFSFFAWDETFGNPGAFVDVTPRGGASAFSIIGAAAVASFNRAAPPLPNLSAGDASQDFQFDQRDIVLALQSGKYLTGQAASWAEGDWNGDSVFDELDIAAALEGGNYLRGRYFEGLPVANGTPRENNEAP